MASNTAVVTYDKLVETQSYQHTRNLVMKDVNYFLHPRLIGKTMYAPFTIADPGRVHQTNYDEFKKSKLEKENIKDLKSDWKKEQRKKYGSTWVKKDAGKSKYLELHVKI